MEQLPSYNEATQPRDWLDTVAPYIDVRDYTNLCLVSRRFYARFALRIWKDPLSTVRALGLDPDDGKSLPFHLGRAVTDATQSTTATKAS